MRMQPMCAPWRKAFYSYTKASQRTPWPCWWVRRGGSCSSCLPHSQPPTVCFYLLELKETVVKLKSFADNFSSYTSFLQKILPYQLKRSVCVRGAGDCVKKIKIKMRLRLYWSSPLCSAWKKNATHLLVQLPLLPKTRICRATWREWLRALRSCRATLRFWPYPVGSHWKYIPYVID